MKTLWQIFAIARTEFRFGLRRGAPVITTVVIGLIVAAGILLNPATGLEYTFPNDVPQEQITKLAEHGITIESLRLIGRDSLVDLIAYSSLDGWNLMFFALVFLPVATSIAIPADRKFGAHELLRSTPINGTVYLAGKILGSFGIVFIISLFPFLMFFSVVEIILVKATHFGLTANLVGFYVELAILDGVPLLFWASAVGVLTGVAFRSRRGAIFPGFLIGLLSLLFWRAAFKTPSTPLPVTDQAAYYVLQNYSPIAPETMTKVYGREVNAWSMSILGDGAPVMGIGQVVVMYVVLLIALFILASLARQWLKWKENF